MLQYLPVWHSPPLSSQMIPAGNWVVAWRMLSPWSFHTAECQQLSPTNCQFSALLQHQVLHTDWNRTLDTSTEQCLQCLQRVSDCEERPPLLDPYRLILERERTWMREKDGISVPGMLLARCHTQIPAITTFIATMDFKNFLCVHRDEDQRLLNGSYHRTVPACSGTNNKRQIITIHCLTLTHNDPQTVELR